jgi:hypothetical protein
VFSHRGRHTGICLCFHWRFVVEMAGVKAVVWIVVFRRYPRSGIGLVTYCNSRANSQDRGAQFLRFHQNCQNTIFPLKLPRTVGNGVV